MSDDGWLDGLAALGCSFLKLQRNGKRPVQGFDHALKGRRGAEAARRWLARGWNVGILPGPRLWVLDIDEPGQIERVVSEIFERGSHPLAVSTPSGGMHLYGMLPDDFPLAGLKNHLHQDGLGDFKLGPRTLIVCPGSRRNGIEYRPTSGWTTPPVLDPRWFRADGFWKTPDSRPFLTNQRPLGDRLVAARKYLETIAPVSVSGRRGHLALARVCSHVVAFHRIEPRTALAMLAPWNSRCTDTAGKPCPWSRSELQSALDAAVGSVPEAGVKAYERAEAAHAKKDLLGRLVSCVQKAHGSDRVSVGSIRRLIQLAALPGLTHKELGGILTAARIPRIMSGPKRTLAIENLDFDCLLELVLLEVGRPGKGTEERPLNKQGSSHVRKWTPLCPIERIVSERIAS